ncbi:tetratricopeptide repeat protein [Vogesella sp. DC21W]|uniref:Tetratricopeptide repeat protein n=1 Tax=Vogesella aquatica TaxID=2984206 RepID=A0ABT5ITB3_9NEIS|nr:tetratricopeptide repeat protein [Vogesella aquatica]MDC7715814.1 tetratricopeptide repeat protein [Vogesella aquatica]
MTLSRAILPLLLLLPALALGQLATPPDSGQEDWPALLENSARPAMQGRLEESEQQLRALLARAPADQPALQADILHRLQFVLRSRQQTTAALAAASQALALRQQAFGQSHLLVAESQQAYARLLAATQPDSAEKLLLAALQTRDQLAGSESLDAAESHHALGLFYLQQKQYDSAAVQLGRALVIRQKRLPADHPDTLYTQARLGAALQQQKQYERAIGLLQDALEGEARRGNADGLHAAIITRELAYCYHYQQDYPSAEALYKQALTLLALNLGSQHYAYAITQQALGWLYISSQRESQGRALLENARQLLQQADKQPAQRK